MASSILLRFSRLFDFKDVIFLLDMHLAIKLSEFLMLLISEAKYSIDP